MDASDSAGLSQDLSPQLVACKTPALRPHCDRQASQTPPADKQYSFFDGWRDPRANADGKVESLFSFNLVPRNVTSQPGPGYPGRCGGVGGGVGGALGLG